MKTTFIYKMFDHGEIKGDFYPIEEKKAPLIVFIHGGGLIWGSRTDIHHEQVALYHAAGFNVCSIDHRLAPETKLSQITKDIQDALNWLKKTDDNTYDFDPDRVAVVGSSAGGYLALLSGTFNVKPKAIVSLYGYGDIISDWYTKPSPHFTKMPKVPETLLHRLIRHKPITEASIEERYAIYLFCRQQGKWNEYVTGFSPHTSAEELTPYCPVKNVNSNYPPTLLLHGSADRDVPYEESVKMKEVLSQYHIKHQLITIPNGEHSFDQDMQHSVVKDAFHKVIAFLKTNV